MFSLTTHISPQDQVIVPLTHTGLKGSTTGTLDESDPLLVVHPNYILDS